MPVNSFDDYPMAWKPEKSRLSGPLYAAIAGALEEDIVEGGSPPIPSCRPSGSWRIFSTSI